MDAHRDHGQGVRIAIGVFVREAEGCKARKNGDGVLDKSKNAVKGAPKRPVAGSLTVSQARV